MGNTGTAVKIGAAAIGGYILGRRKKLKLAIGLGLYLGAKKLDISPQMLVKGLTKELSSLPVVGELKDQTREQLLGAGKDAAGKLVTTWAGNLADSLNDRTERLRSGATGAASSAAGAATGAVGTAAGTRGGDDEDADDDHDADDRDGAERDEARGADDGADGAKASRTNQRTRRGTASAAKSTTKSAAKKGRAASSSAAKPARRRTRSTDGEGDRG
ncbi:hypothetical protein [Nocardiopsis trehalosi]|uniref:hypothetical protein n=1 Tax=Nocardiopsis trehalosi TaxID=109329 RepID=UPI000835FBDA|nr:hypothetical protein [Nocardiopsis trehalosi]